MSKPTFLCEGFKLQLEDRPFQLSPPFAESVGLVPHLRGEAVPCKGCYFTHVDKARVGGLGSPAQKSYTKTCTEPACNNKATVTHQLSNAVLEKEHTALPCYAAQGSATLLTLT